jgi:hypothetical protein
MSMRVPVFSRSRCRRVTALDLRYKSIAAPPFQKHQNSEELLRCERAALRITR